ncbi:MAG TPA: AarF/UbiB family protein [Polyangia bacterium]|jgi:predicted unusual protein kinase regulating ubiquinone biosynthesis (AarF/ABC1/UbiB family)
MPDDHRDDPGPLTQLARGFRQRTLVTVGLASRLGLGLLRKNLSHTEVAAGIDEEDAVRAATELLAQLDGLKGLVMKFGQMASYLSPTLPPQAQRILGRLQAASRPMAYEGIAEVVRGDLGAAPEALFDEFAREPFAAASIGQVHRARLDGAALAVKVQYPGVDALLEADFKTITRLARLVFATPTSTCSARTTSCSSATRTASAPRCRATGCS